MAAISDCPELSSRCYGKKDFERFDHLLSQQASLGPFSVGRVKVDCRFLFQKSQWGVMSPKRHPAGIVYLDLHIHQPKKYRLKSTTITVTLDDDDSELMRLWPAAEPTHPVQIGFYGPKQLHGQPRRIIRRRKNNLTPNFEVGGVAGFGGIGHDSEEHYVRESRWTLNTELSRDTRKTGKHSLPTRVLVWELTENELDAQPVHSNTIHTAFSFEHDGQPFLMKVEVAGRLDNAQRDMRNRMKMKFPASCKRQQSATILINFGGRGKFNKPLDEIAKGLSWAMERENLESVPVEIPDPQVPYFQHDHRADIEAQGRLEGIHPGRLIGDQANQRVSELLNQDWRRGRQGIVEYSYASSQETTVKNRPSTVDPDQGELADVFPALARATSGDLYYDLSQPITLNNEPHQSEEQYRGTPPPMAPTPSRPGMTSKTFPQVVDTSSSVAVGADDRVANTDQMRGKHPQNHEQQLAQEIMLILLKVFGIVRLVELALGLAARFGVKLAPLSQHTDKRGETQHHRLGDPRPKAASRSTRAQEAQGH